MTLDLRWNDQQQAIADAVAKFCRECVTPEVLKTSRDPFSSELWREFAALGFFALGTPEGGGGALEIVAAVEPLGRAVFPGPIVETFHAIQVIDDELREGLTSGRRVVWVPFSPPMRSGTDPTRARTDHADGERGWLIHDIVTAAYLAAAGEGLVAVASEHARTRIQFGKTIGRFQAVAHPLADCTMRLAAARTLARSAAFHFDMGRATAARGLAGAARLSARKAALEAATVCHQVLGAIGITLEGPAYHVSRRVLELASAEPFFTTRAAAGECPRVEFARDAILSHLGVES